MSISIHTTRVGGDLFLGKDAFGIVISIHTTRVGGDLYALKHGGAVADFNPHHPCGW